jgi:hypothetical protein
MLYKLALQTGSFGSGRISGKFVGNFSYRLGKVARHPTMIQKSEA